VSKLAARRNLLKNLVLKDLKHRYVGSVGGFAWSVIHPLVLLASYTFVFTKVLHLSVDPQFKTGSFALFLFCGILPWILFSDTLMRNCTSITDNTALVTKTVIPSEMLPMAITLSNLVHHAIGLGILLVVLAVFHTVPVSALGVFLYIPIVVLLAQGLGWILAALQVFLRDTVQGLQILLFLWFWFTPVLYSADRVPARFLWAFKLNPMVLIVTGYRNSLLGLPQPTPGEIVKALFVSMAVFVIGALVFRKAKPSLPDFL
jgi:lipopolysaccharide transport system permease protein